MVQEEVEGFRGAEGPDPVGGSHGWVSQALRGSEGGSNSGRRAPCLTAIESASYKLGYPQNVVKQYSVLEHAEIAFMQGMPGCGTDQSGVLLNSPGGGQGEGSVAPKRVKPISS